MKIQFQILLVIIFIVIAITGLIIAFIFGFVLALITSNLLGSINWDFVTASFISDLFKNFGWTLFTLLPYILMASFFAFLGRSAIAGIGGGLGFYFIEAIAVSIFNQSGGWLANIPDFLIGPNVDALLPSSLFTQGPFSSGDIITSTLNASLTLTVYCVVFLSISLLMFRKRDLIV